MKESAQIALSYVRSVVEEKQISAEYFEKHDFHLHVPEGAVPKDGPSAGITMATAIYSVVTGIPVKADVAKLQPLTYDSMHHQYLVLGQAVGHAFQDGLALKE